MTSAAPHYLILFRSIWSQQSLVLFVALVQELQLNFFEWGLLDTC